jgi:hypothetical protein
MTGWTLSAAAVVSVAALPAAEPVSPAEAREALHRAVHFFRTQASAGGGYIYRLSADLTKREGEGVVGPTTAWIQPPGTPAVGLAYLNAYRLTRDPVLLDAAHETALCLVRGQLVSGGWDNMIEFDPARRRRIAYRVDGNREGANTTTFDDDKSQSALRFLMQFDRERQFEDEVVHEAVRYAQESFLKAQYPNGAWPQRYRDDPRAEDFPVLAASYPQEWPRTFPEVDYQGFYTLNDNTISDLIVTMLDAADIYGEERFRQSAVRGGEFFLLAQMPEPQPGWCQQYDREMHPVWARKFEPPALSGGESQGVMQTLLLLYRRTGEARFLEPIPRALAYYRRSLRPDGRLARFYELGTNRPLYFTKDYQLTDSDADMPTHYGFIVGSKLESISRTYEELQQTSPAERASSPPSATRPVETPRMSERLAEEAAGVVRALDERGAWVEAGRLRDHPSDATTQVIESATFIRNLDVLSRYLAASSAR